MVTIADALVTSPYGDKPQSIPSLPLPIGYIDKLTAVTDLVQKTALINSSLMLTWGGDRPAAEKIIERLRKQAPAYGRNAGPILDMVNEEFGRYNNSFKSNKKRSLKLVVHFNLEDEFYYESYGVSRSKWAPYSRVLLFGDGEEDFYQLAIEGFDPKEVLDKPGLLANAASLIGMGIFRQGQNEFGLTNKWGGALEIVSRDNDGFRKINNFLMQAVHVYEENGQVLITKNPQHYFHTYLGHHMYAYGWGNANRPHYVRPIGLEGEAPPPPSGIFQPDFVLDIYILHPPYVRGDHDYEIVTTYSMHPRAFGDMSSQNKIKERVRLSPQGMIVSYDNEEILEAVHRVIADISQK